MRKFLAKISLLTFVLSFTFGSTAFAGTLSTNIQQGISMSSYDAGEFSESSADTAWRQIKNTGAEWTSIVVTQYMNDISSTDIKATGSTASDTDIRNAIRDAKRLGLKVMLKPQLDLNNDSSHWRGQIGSDFSNTDWDTWFEEYTEIITRYAEIADDENVEQFVVGSELIEASKHEDEWREVIQEVKRVYSGKLLYAANHSGEENQIKFWDALDYIGIDAYYKLTTKTDPTLAELKAGWNSAINTMRSLSEKWGKRVIITAIGYRSVEGSGRNPWDYSSNGEVDLQGQKLLYQAMFENLNNQNWLRGIFIWRWDSDPNESGSNDDGYSPYRKPAETVLKQWFKGGNTDNNGRDDEDDDNDDKDEDEEERLERRNNEEDGVIEYEIEDSDSYDDDDDDNDLNRRQNRNRNRY